MTFFINHYRCANCGCVWDDEADCTCNDRCPECRDETEPESSDDSPEEPSASQLAAQAAGDKILAGLMLRATKQELLDALQNLMQYSEHHDGECPTDSGLGAYLQAKAAIKKATGA